MLMKAGNNARPTAKTKRFRMHIIRIISNTTAAGATTKPTTKSSGCVPMAAPHRAT